MRPSKACQVCRSRKQRCEFKDESRTACHYCESRSLECSFSREPWRVGWSGPPESPITVSSSATAPESVQKSASSSAESGMPPQEVCEDLIQVYFSTMHNTHHALFHRPTFMKDFNEGNIPQVILLSIFALIARFSNHAYFEGINRGIRGHEWSQAAKRMLNIQAMDMSICTLQACLLVGCLAMADGDSASEAICSAIANRVVQLLDFPNRMSPDPLQREIEIRVFWSIYMMDMWSATGNRIPRAFVLNNSWLWPMEELAFDQWHTSHYQHETNILGNDHPSRRFSLWGSMIPLSDLKGQIHDLNDHFRDASCVGDGRLLESVSALSSRLEQWESSLPPHMQDTPENLASFALLGLSRSFIALHIGYHYYAVLLYFRFLYANFRFESGTQATIYARRCKFHATAISENLWAGYHKYDSECAWPLVSHLLVISSSVHLHTLLLDSDSETVAHARILLHQNFLLLLRLKEVWPWLLNSMTRLKAFHRACLRTLEAEDAFRMDDWMMQFLQEHSKAIVEDRVGGSGQLFDFENWGSMTP